MSHDATNWAIKQRGLKPAAKVVLWHLCDRYHADHGCFPSQETLAADCEMSRSSLNEQLAELERLGLIRREQRLDERTKRQRSTRYVFPFEKDFAEGLTQDVVVPCPDIGHGAVSEKQPEPCPENGQSRVQNLDTNSVREPVREPRSARVGAREEAGFNMLWEAWPAQHRPDNRSAAQALFEKLSADERRQAIHYASAHHRRQILRKERPLMVPYLKRRLFEELHGAPPIDEAGDFVITPDRPEWSEWLGDIRRRYGEPGVRSILKCKQVRQPRRWPEKQVQAAE